MRLFTAVTLLGGAVAAQEFVRGAHKPSPMAGGQIFARQLEECASIPPPFTCERSCGHGYESCVFDLLCYNPGAGESCCSNGSYCPAGSYCSDNGCCLNEWSLEECGATTRISTLPPGAVPTSDSISTPTSTTSTEREGSTSESESETETSETETQTSTGTTPIPTPPITTGPSGSNGLPTPTGGNSTVTTQGPPTDGPPEQPSNVAVPLKGAAGTFALGWVGVVMALL